MSEYCDADSECNAKNSDDEFQDAVGARAAMEARTNDEASARSSICRPKTPANESETGSSGRQSAKSRLRRPMVVFNRQEHERRGTGRAGLGGRSAFSETETDGGKKRRNDRRARPVSEQSAQNVGSSSSEALTNEGSYTLKDFVQGKIDAKKDRPGITSLRRSNLLSTYDPRNVKTEPSSSGVESSLMCCQSNLKSNSPTKNRVSRLKEIKSIQQRIEMRKKALQEEYVAKKPKNTTDLSRSEADSSVPSVSLIMGKDSSGVGDSSNAENTNASTDYVDENESKCEKVYEVGIVQEQNIAEAEIEFPQNDIQPEDNEKDGPSRYFNKFDKTLSRSQESQVCWPKDAEKKGCVEISEVAINTDPTGELRINDLQKEIIQLVDNQEILKKENENLNVALAKQRSKDSIIRKELSNATEALMLSENKCAEYEKRISEKENTISKFRVKVNKLNSVVEQLATKEAETAKLLRELNEYKELLSKLKKDYDAKCEQYDRIRRENAKYQSSVFRLEEEKQEQEIYISSLVSEMELRESSLSSTVINEREKNKHLELELSNAKAKINSLDIQLKEAENGSKSSHNILQLSEQLLQKDSIICELETMRNKSQQIVSDVCFMLSSVLEKNGELMSKDEVLSLVTTGRTQAIEEKLLRQRMTDDEHAECRRAKAALETRAAGLEEELARWRRDAERLAGAVAALKAAGGGAGSGGRREAPEKEAAGGGEAGPPRDRYELFALLEQKRQALHRMERRLSQLEQVHSHCSQKRVRNEIRIDQLEKALAAVSLNWA